MLQRGYLKSTSLFNKYDEEKIVKEWQRIFTESFHPVVIVFNENFATNKQDLSINISDSLFHFDS